jgi:hypothetical protein
MRRKAVAKVILRVSRSCVTGDGTGARTAGVIEMTVFNDSFAHSQIVELEHKDLTPPESRVAGDHFAHAAGRICKTCDRVIEAGQAARRRGESGWVHDVCPFPDDDH